MTHQKIARVYLRVSTQEQDLERQEAVILEASAAGYYIAGIYREKASGTLAERPELARLLADLQPGDILVAERMDRISRLPLPEAERLIETIKAKGASLAVPGIVDLSEITKGSVGVPKIVLDAMQDMMLRIALQMARDDYETLRHRQRQGIERAKAAGRYAGRRANPVLHERIVTLRKAGLSIAKTAELAGCSKTHVKRVWSKRG